MIKNKLKIKTGDSVKIISGKDKGKTGKVLRVLPAIRKVVVEGANIHSRFERGKRPGQVGQKISSSSPLHVSNVMLIDPHSGKSTRVGFEILPDGTKQRMAKASKKAI